MGEGVLTDDGLIVLDRKASDGRDIAAGAGDVGAVDAGLEGQTVSPHLQRHDDLFQRRITGPLAKAIDGTFYLARAALNPGQTIGHGQAQIIVTVGREDHPVRALDILGHPAEQVRIF